VKRILVTGGAGFIGSHLSDHLLARGYEVRALDVLDSQVHPDGKRPEYLDPAVELCVADVRDKEAVKKALAGVDAVFHFAAAVGVGQSMYEVERYTSVNSLGTAVLLEALLGARVRKLVVASSMSVYGEGLFRDGDGNIVAGHERSLTQLKLRRWEVLDKAGNPLTPVPTPESKTPALPSVYALGKYDQERMCLLIGNAYGIPTVALRFFNVYGTRQALSNPYTGVLAIFASRLLNKKPPLINEDGRQRRDFVSVHDVARACMLALERGGADGLAVNVGSGTSVTVREVAERMSAALGIPMDAEITAKYRMGDIRHCFADIRRAHELLGYEPKVSFSEGIRELAGWLEGRVAADRVAEAAAELAGRGLTV
jgi:dTDP-L-rhamnose 4-epimerase